MIRRLASSVVNLRKVEVAVGMSVFDDVITVRESSHATTVEISVTLLATWGKMAVQIM